MREVLHTVLIEFGVPLKLVKLIKMCLNETCRKARTDKRLSDSFPIQNGLKQGYILSPFPVSFPSKYGIREVHENKSVLELNGTHELLVSAADVSSLSESVSIIHKNKGANYILLTMLVYK
jgi:hypothetical protein